MRLLTLALAVSLLSTGTLNAQAATDPVFRVKAEVLVNGKIVAAPTFTVRSGEAGRITQGTPNSASYLDVKVTPTKADSAENPNKIALETAIAYRSEGVKRDLNTRVMVEPNSKELMSLNPGKSTRDFEVRVGAEQI
ncbi:MAG: hypothetical protein EOP06_00035 [Proteobacteria bacterium]|nr:MAG: hypothetical protein EOP06_00035 [Pseudomonadota bacterium]